MRPGYASMAVVYRIYIHTLYGIHTNTNNNHSFYRHNTYVYVYALLRVLVKSTKRHNRRLPTRPDKYTVDEDWGSHQQKGKKRRYNRDSYEVVKYI